MNNAFTRASSRVTRNLKMLLPERLLSARARVTLGEVTGSVSTCLNNIRIPAAQERLLKQNYSASTKRLIVFLTQGPDIIHGGILSISSIYGETEKLKSIHGAETIMCTVPGDRLVLRYTKFKNQNYIYSFSRVLSYFGSLQYLMIHIPENAVERFVKNLTQEDYRRLRKLRDVHVNIMLQNIEFLSPMKHIDSLRELGHLSCTTAHEKYSTLELRKKFGFPLHMLSVWISPEQYHRNSYDQKENLMIVSPDTHPKKKEILNLIASELPKLKLQIIQNLTYEEYKNTISRAKWALTFGEGLDGYFVETVFSGGISFSRYNSKFFTEDFRCLHTVYDNYDALTRKICSDIKELDNKVAFADYQNAQYALCSKHYNFKEYVNNLRLFYQGKYTYN